MTVHFCIIFSINNLVGKEKEVEERNRKHKHRSNGVTEEENSEIRLKLLSLLKFRELNLVHIGPTTKGNKVNAYGGPIMHFPQMKKKFRPCNFLECLLHILTTLGTCFNESNIVCLKSSSIFWF